MRYLFNSVRTDCPASGYSVGFCWIVGMGFAAFVLLALTIVETVGKFIACWMDTTYKLYTLLIIGILAAQCSSILRYLVLFIC